MWVIIWTNVVSAIGGGIFGGFMVYWWVRVEGYQDGRFGEGPDQ